MAPSSELKIVGKSTIRIWTMISKEAVGQGVFDMDGAKFIGVKGLEVTMPSESLKSGTKGLDRHAHESLQTSKYQSVKFALKEIRKAGESFEAKGELTIACITRELVFLVKVDQIGSDIRFQGEIPIKFSDFDLITPTNFMGLIKTHDDARIVFDTTFSPDK